MTLPEKLSKKYLSRFEELVAKGENILFKMLLPVSQYHNNPYKINNNAHYRKLAEWKINCISLLNKCLSKENIHQGLINEFKRLEDNDKYLLEICISNLKAIKEDYEQGFLGDLMLQVEAEIAADYMGQAEKLLAEGTSGKYDHVPAAVLSGAVLEKALRTICIKQTPPISTIKENGEPLTLNPLIDVIKKAGIFNELKAKQLRAWADIRNQAAHGEFEKFTRSDVELMIKGIENFLADYMT
ncbi:DUF4145 domain-containing protein [Nodularia spumigena CS-584]|uniref:DUF4145 domain-containing protein n=1 Tax=Nodularia spumigena TaxID=70799 RepID=UPI0000EAAF6B|nr:DUF4145 domain-containing protein [Nodularia spumigena]AHJ27845.1 hypothetical protein NSP_15110 [Nodularia spumigena CCY9414]EAW46797.1 hypothetical protein N9414_17508 [Nodularia spumigena CCY9414]MDB9383485.1 DUF4145 domain-containing protein [Nodularia spumigena CS-584]